jgi:hypothetical protein
VIAGERVPVPTGSEDPGRAAQVRVDRRVVGVQRQADAGPLGDRQHGVEEVLVVGLELVGVDGLRRVG